MNIRELNSPPLNLNYQCFNVIIPPSTLPLPIRGTGMGLVWSDEFTGTSLDTTKWNTNGPWDLGGNIQSYNVTVSNGDVHLRVIDESGTWTTSIISTNFNLKWLYGFFEFRAKLPVAGNGVWPALWLLGQGPTDWSNKGELDVLEWLGNDVTKVYQTWHYGVDTGYQGGQNISTATNWTTDYHLYQMWWKSGYVAFYIDNVLQGQWTSSNIPNIPMYVMCNNIMGGWNNNNPDGTTPSPAYMEVDYVRIYQ